MSVSGSTTASQLEQDQAWMAQALQEADKGLWTTTPNPRVGCVIVKNGQAVATGWHRKAGEPHAEVNAIRNAQTHGIDLNGATVYVALEPCAHQGRTGPCAEALSKLPIQRVVMATLDPNPLVAGKGKALLEAAGIQTTEGVLASEARWLNRGFFSRMERGRPWVRLKTACSADGVTALQNGVSQWITSPEARLDGHRLRAQACAVLTGIGTVKADDPLLNVRGLDTPRQPAKVVVDSHLEINPNAKLLAEGTVYLAHAAAPIPAWASNWDSNGKAELRLLNASPANTDTDTDTDNIHSFVRKPKTDLARLLKMLAEEHIQELHLEAGFGLNGSFMAAGLVDEIVQYIAPRFLGQGQGLFRLPALETLPTGSDWQVRELTQVGPDVKIVWVRSAHSRSDTQPG